MRKFLVYKSTRLDGIHVRVLTLLAELKNHSVYQKSHSCQTHPQKREMYCKSKDMERN